MPLFLSPLLILFSVALYGLVHSWLASSGVKTRVRDILGQHKARIYRLSYNAFAVLSFLPVLGLTIFLPDKSIYSIAFPWIILTSTVQVLAVLSVLIGLWQTGFWNFLGLEQILSSSGETTQKFVQNGMYRWVRHPLYTAALIFIWLTPLMTVNLLTLITGLSVYLVVGAYIEEGKLKREFGKDYSYYRERTPMLFPIKFKKYLSRD